MKVLITGGAGFIGSHLVRLLLDQGHHVHIVDDLSTGRRENVAEVLGPNCVLQVQKAGEALEHFTWLRDFDAIYHLAAAVGVKLIVEQPVHTIETNVLETSAVLRAAAAFSIPVLIASSSEVYGKSDRVPFREDDDVTYGATLYSRWSYAMTKALDEYLALAHHQQTSAPVVVVRLFNTVGPRQTGRYGMVLPRFIESAIGENPIDIYGDGQQTRCFAHVADVVQAMPKLLAEPSCWGRVFNLGSDEEVTIEQLADRVIAAAGSKSEKRYVAYEQAYRTAFEDLKRRVPDLSRVRQAIDYRPTRDLDAIVGELVALERARHSPHDTGEPAHA